MEIHLRTNYKERNTTAEFDHRPSLPVQLIVKDVILLMLLKVILTQSVSCVLYLRSLHMYIAAWLH